MDKKRSRDTVDDDDQTIGQGKKIPTLDPTVAALSGGTSGGPSLQSDTFNADNAIRAPWTSKANDVLTLQIGDNTFPPVFTYPFFGVEETITGYKGLRILLHYTPDTLEAILKVSYLDKVDEEGSKDIIARVPVDDIPKLITKELPRVFTAKEDYETAVKKHKIKAFIPPGEVVAKYELEIDGKVRQFIVTWCTSKTEGFKDYLMKMQAFLLFFIEGATFVDDDERWEFFMLFEESKSESTPSQLDYKFIGYTSLFPFFFYPNKIRMRLSQFLILPPFARLGHGSHLYRAVYRHVVAKEEVIELTVEDPNEYFDLLRDRADILLPFPTSKIPDDAKSFFDIENPAKSVLLGASKPPNYPQKVKSPNYQGIPVIGSQEELDKITEKVRKYLKLSKRQAVRCLEILQLQGIHHSREDGTDSVAKGSVKAYRLALKRRLFQANYASDAIDDETRKTQLDVTYKWVKEGYDITLRNVNWTL